MQEMQVRFVGPIRGSERFLKGGNGNPLQYSAWRIPWTEEPGRLQSMRSHKSDMTESTEHACIHTPTTVFVDQRVMEGLPG